MVVYTIAVENSCMLLLRLSDMSANIGRRLGPSEWLAIDQPLIDLFARVTDDHNWIHVDVERAKRDLPGGATIAHGFLTLSLLPRLTRTIFEIAEFSRGLNYGANRIRFTGEVPSGSRIRLHLQVKDVRLVNDAVRMTFDNLVEVEGQQRPALVAETIYQYYE
jgi:acyl dehydratase